MAGAMHINAIEAMDRHDFHQNIVEKIGMRKDFSTLVTFGADALTDQEKLDLRLAMASNGIPLELTDTDMTLTAAAHQIAARAIQLR